LCGTSRFDETVGASVNFSHAIHVTEGYYHTTAGVKMDAGCYSEMLVFTVETTQCYKPRRMHRCMKSSLTLREEHKLQVSEIEVCRKIHRHKKNEVKVNY
jgi:hypothetical protein